MEIPSVAAIKTEPFTHQYIYTLVARRDEILDEIDRLRSYITGLEVQYNVLTLRIKEARERQQNNAT